MGGEGNLVSNIEKCRTEDLGKRIQDETKELSERYGIMITDEKMISEAFQPQPLTSDLRKYAALLELDAVLRYFPRAHDGRDKAGRGTDGFQSVLQGT